MRRTTRIFAQIFGTTLCAGLLACPQTPRPERTHWRPVDVSPRRGSVQGGDLVFVELGHPKILPRGPVRHVDPELLAVFCRFGAATVPARWSRTVKRHVCTVPPHDQPESVDLSVVVNGRARPLGRYAYTTVGKQDLPLLRVHAAPILKKSRRIRKRLPKGVGYGVVLKKTEPIAALGRLLSATGGVDRLFVSTVHDGIRLRRHKIKKPIVVLFAVDPKRALELLHHDLEPAALSADWVRRANRVLRGQTTPLKVHLWIDTGLGRQGVLPGDAVALAGLIEKSPRLTLAGISTHLCCVKPTDGAALQNNDLTNRTVQQKARFDGAVKSIRAAGFGKKALLHVGASDVVRYGLTALYYDLVRVGCLLLENDVKPRPNYTWTSRVMQVKTLPKGWCLGYGCQRRTERVTRVALLGHTPLLNLEYWIHGRPARVLLHHGYTVLLDITDHRPVQEGDAVNLAFRSARGNLVSDPPTPVTLTVAPQTVRALRYRSVRAR